MWKDEYGYRQLAKEGGEYVRVDGAATKGRMNSDFEGILQIQLSHHNDG